MSFHVPVSSDYLRSLSNVTVYPYKRVLEFVEENGKFAGVKLADKETGKNEQVVYCDGVFEYIGAIPSTEFFKGTDIIGSHGYINYCSCTRKYKRSRLLSHIP